MRYAFVEHFLCGEAIFIIFLFIWQWHAQLVQRTVTVLLFGSINYFCFQYNLAIKQMQFLSEIVNHENTTHKRFEVYYSWFLVDKREHVENWPTILAHFHYIIRVQRIRVSFFRKIDICFFDISSSWCWNCFINLLLIISFHFARYIFVEICDISQARV